MKSTMKHLSGALLIGLFLVGAVVLMSSWLGSSVDAAAQDASTLTQLSVVEASQVEAFQVDATLHGTVELEWGATGAYSDTWATDELNALSDGATIDIMFLLQKGVGDAVTGYVELQNSLIFTTEHTISTTVVNGDDAPPTEAMTEVGPKIDGSYSGNQINLLSERISYTTESGQAVQRQFRLTASPNPGSETLTGEYRETLWGATLEPLTIGGVFKLRELKAAPADVNRAPIANPQTVTTSADTAKAITLTGSDADNDALTYTITTDPIRGALSGTAPNVTYTPKAGFVGSDSFTFYVNDGAVDSDSVAVSITVEGRGDNRPPIAGADSATTSIGVAVAINVLANDSDPDGDALTVTINQQPENGRAEVSGVTIVYTPNANFSGVDKLIYTVTDSKSAIASATITITVQTQGTGTTIYLPMIHK